MAVPMHGTSARLPYPETHHIDLSPTIRERVRQIPVPTEIVEHVEEVPETHHVERIEEALAPQVYTRPVPVPEFNVTERVVEVPKPIIQEQIVEIPEIEWVEKIVEVPQYVYKERCIEVRKPIVREKIIPAPEPSIRESVVYQPPHHTEEHVVTHRPHASPYIAEEESYGPDYPTSGPVPYPPPPYHPGYLEPPAYALPPPTPSHASYRSPSLSVQPWGLPPPGPVYREIPRHVAVGIPHYRPIVTEHLVDRPVGVPVELCVEQEYYEPHVHAHCIPVPVDIPYPPYDFNPTCRYPASFPYSWDYPSLRSSTDSIPEAPVLVDASIRQGYCPTRGQGPAAAHLPGISTYLGPFRLPPTRYARNKSRLRNK